MSPHEKYKSNIVSTATKEQKMAIIFNQMIVILSKAAKCIETNDFAGKNEKLQAVVESFQTLRAALDVEKGGEFAANLDIFCQRISNKINSINMDESNSPAELNDVIKGIMQVKELFEEEKSEG